MNTIKITITIVFLCLVSVVYSQPFSIKGHVSDKQGNNLFAVSVCLYGHNTIGTGTDLDGNFTLKIQDPELIKNEHLVFSFIGFEPLKVSLDSINYSEPVNVCLDENVQALNAVVVQGRKSISREFSVKEMDKLKIYLSPLASADPLKAVAMLPSSTNTSETANPELRGSSANRTKIFLNGVPVSNPVRNSQINGIGFFSLFNPELIKTMLVYPSNPPLIYGNTSAGMIDIETEEKLENSSYGLSVSLASTGISVSQKINEKSFIQIYGNLMFSKGFLSVNPEINKQVKGFTSNDIGLNYHNEITENLTLNIYNYLVSESSNVVINLFTWSDNAIVKTIRDFSIMNLKYQKSKHYLTFNAGTNFSRSDFSFGNISSEFSQQQAYLSLNYKFLFSNNLYVQAGLSNESGNFDFNDTVPAFYYALSPESPSFQHDTILKNNLPESYGYLRWKPIRNITWGIGVRKKIDFIQGKNPDYLSIQTNLRYNFLNYHSLLFSAGRYNNITEPNSTQEEFRMLSADQIALEYLFEAKKTNINLAVYSKSEKGDTTGKRKINGCEIYIEHNITRSLKASVSNTILNSDIWSDDGFPDENNVGYFLVTTLSYFNPRLFNVSVAWSTREGKFYTPVSSSIYNPSIDCYQPVYGDKNARLSNYNTINMSINRSISLGKQSIVLYASIFNLLDARNPKNVIYNKDYTTNTFDYYQKRSIYFGCMLTM